MENLHLNYFLVGALGALAFELLRMYELYGKLNTRKFRALFGSFLYWVTFAGMVAASGFVAWAIYVDGGEPTHWQLILSGIGARSLVSKPIELGVVKIGQLGVKSSASPDSRENKLTLRDIFS